MKKILKYKIEDGDTIVRAPVEKWLTAKTQGDYVVVWAAINTEFEEQEWYLYTLGTGWACKRIPGEYLGTVQEPGTGWIWHVFAAQVRRPTKVDSDWIDESEGFYIS